MEFLQYVLAFIVTLGVLVTFHEFGHFVIARWCGVKVLRFSVGFGRPLWSRTDRHGTEFAIAAVPLGGYVKMLDEREGPVPETEAHRAFNRLPPIQRIAIALGGPLANFLLAIIVYWAIFVMGTTALVPVIAEPEPETPAYAAGLRGGEEIVSVDGTETLSWQQVGMALVGRLGETGAIEIATRTPGGERIGVHRIGVERWHRGQDEPDLLASLGLRPELPATVGEVLSEGPATAAGLEPNDRVISVDGEPVGNWNDWVEVVRAAPGETLMLEIERNGVQRSVALRPESRDTVGGEPIGYVGVAPLMREIEHSLLGAIGPSLRETWSKTLLTLEMLKKMVQGSVSTKNLSGPITIAQVAGDSAAAGIENFLNVLALISIGLGVLNLLPIPILDGGHIVMHTAELITGKPVSERVQVLSVQVGLVIIGGLMLLALYNDIARLL